MGEYMKQNENSSKLLWLLLVVVVPAVFTIAIFGILLSFVGVSVVEEAKSIGKNIPVIKMLLYEDAEATAAATNDQEKQWKSKFDEQEDYIKMLSADLQNKEKQVTELKNNIALLEKQVEDAESSVKEEGNQQLKKLYEAMSANDAAAVMTKMNNNQVLGILILLEPETQSEILAKIDAERAAELTVLMANDSL
jgi:flagellar motility protein MotE (MotC chaperone)